MLCGELHEFINEHITQLVEMEKKFLDCPSGVSQLDFIRYCCLLHIDDPEIVAKIVQDMCSGERLRVRKAIGVILHEYHDSKNAPENTDNAEWARRTRILLEKIDQDSKWDECEKLEIWLSSILGHVFDLDEFIEKTVFPAEIDFYTLSNFKTIAFALDMSSELTAATRSDEERKQLYCLASTISQKAYLNMLTSKNPKAWEELVGGAERVMRLLHEARFPTILPFGMEFPGEQPVIETGYQNDAIACFIFDLIDRSIDVLKTTDSDIPPGFEPENYHRFTSLMKITNPLNIENTLKKCTKTKLQALEATGVKFQELLENRKSKEDLADIKHVQTILSIVNRIKDPDEWDEHIQQTD